MHPCREFTEKAFRQVEREIEWRGTSFEEKGFDAFTGRMLIEIDPRYFRPTEVALLIG
jgi:GDPmannose 4,6-dehydratase